MRCRSALCLAEVPSAPLHILPAVGEVHRQQQNAVFCLRWPWWSLCSCAKEWTMSVIMCMYFSRVWVNDQYNEVFGVLHQECASSIVLSSLLSILVLEVLSREFCTGVLLELLNTHDLVLFANSLEERISKHNARNAEWKVKGKRPKFLVSDTGFEVLMNSGKCPCAVCFSGNNSIKCSHCKLWVHKECSNITVQLVADPHRVCRKCNGKARPEIVDTVGSIISGSTAWWQTSDSSGGWQHHAWCGVLFVLPGWHTECRYHHMLRGPVRVQESLAHYYHQAPLA